MTSAQYPATAGRGVRFALRTISDQVSPPIRLDGNEGAVGLREAALGPTLRKLTRVTPGR